MSIGVSLAFSFGSAVAGVVVNKSGHYVEFMYVGSVLAIAGIAIVTTLTPTTTTAVWAIGTTLAGLGIGIGIEQPLIGVSAVLKHEDIPLGQSAVYFTQSLGVATFLSAYGSALASQISSGLKSVPAVAQAFEASHGALLGEELRKAVPEGAMSRVLKVVSQSVARSFYISLALACLSLIAAVFMERKTLKRDEQASGQEMHEEKAF